jgi:CHAT domain-containing protein
MVYKLLLLFSFCLLLGCSETQHYNFEFDRSILNEKIKLKSSSIDLSINLVELEIIDKKFNSADSLLNILANKSKNNRQTNEYYFLRGHYFRLTNEIDSSLLFLKKIDSNNLVGYFKISFFKELGIIYCFHKREIDTAFHYLKTAEKHAITYPNYDNLKYEIFYSLSSNYRKNFDYSNAITYINLGRDILFTAPQIDSTRLLNSYLIEANIYYNELNLDKALIQYEKIINIVQHKEIYDYIDTYSKILINKGRFKKIDSLLLKLSQKDADIEKTLHIEYLKGLSIFKQNRFVDAASIFHDVVKQINIDKPTPFYYFDLLNLHCEALINCQNFSEALEINDTSFKISKISLWSPNNKLNKYEIITTLSNRAKLYWRWFQNEGKISRRSIALSLFNKIDEILSSQHANTKSILSIYSQNFEVYDLWVECLLTINSTYNSELLKVIDKRKGILLEIEKRKLFSSYKTGPINKLMLNNVIQKNNFEILNFYLGQNIGVISLVKKDSIISKYFAADETFFANLNCLYSQINSQNYNQEIEFLSKYFYKILFEPIKNHISKENLIFIPDNILFRLPFELLNDKNQTIINNYNIGYTFSLRNLLQVDKSYNFFVPEKSKALLMSYSSSESILRTNSLKNELPFSIKETDEIRKILNKNQISTITFQGYSSSVDNFLSEFNNSTIIHLATHAVTKRNSENNTNLVLFRNKHEIDSLSLIKSVKWTNSPELIFLSGCKTAEGNQFFHEEGLQSLSKEFAISNSKFIVSSFWNIDDKSAYIISKEFYSNLFKNENPFEAISQIKRENVQTKNDLRNYNFRIFLN